MSLPTPRWSYCCKLATLVWLGACPVAYLVTEKVPVQTFVPRLLVTWWVWGVAVALFLWLLSRHAQELSGWVLQIGIAAVMSILEYIEFYVPIALIAFYFGCRYVQR